MMAPISVGELLDKITILELKQEHTQDPSKLLNIETEMAELNDLAKSLKNDSLDDLYQRLKHINRIIWIVEDKIRAKERQQLFDAEFIQLARDVYINNDLRADVKREINLATHSHIVEEKIY